MYPFVRFLASGPGRFIRALAGIALIGWGWFGLTGTTGYTVAVIGLVPLLAGVFDFCVLAPLFGYPFSGARLRALRTV
jgi:hypothetical protein